jgi:hypothetical protein
MAKSRLNKLRLAKTKVRQLIMSKTSCGRLRKAAGKTDLSAEGSA